MKIYVDGNVVYETSVLVTQASIMMPTGEIAIPLPVEYQDLNIKLQATAMALSPLNAQFVKGYVSISEMTEQKAAALIVLNDTTLTEGSVKDTALTKLNEEEVQEEVKKEVKEEVKEKSTAGTKARGK
jgi:hypothetical protein